MSLTKNSVQDIYLKGIIDNSDLAEHYHAQLHNYLECDIVASYYEDMGDRQHRLTLFCCGEKRELTLEQKVQCINLLHAIMDEQGITHCNLDEHRVRRQIQQEKAYRQRKLQSFTPYVAVAVYSFEELGKWHVCYNAYAAKCFLQLQGKCNVLQIIPCDHNSQTTFLVILGQPIAEEDCIRIKNKMLTLLAPYDAFGLFDENSFQPIFRLKRDIPVDEYRMLTFGI